MEDEPTLRGLNRTEAGLLWSVATHGGGPALADGLEPGAATTLRERLEALDTMQPDERQSLAEQWGNAAEEGARSDDDDPSRGLSTAMRRFLAGLEGTGGREPRTPDRLLSTRSDHFVRLVRVEAERFETRVAELGIFQVAVVLRSRNRRRVARVRRRLAASQRALLVAALRRDEEVGEVVRARLRDVLVTLSQHFDGWSTRIDELGCYTVASAASRRFRARLEAMARRAPDSLGDRLRHYYRVCRESARTDVARRMRDRIESFFEWRAGLELEGDDGG